MRVDFVIVTALEEERDAVLSKLSRTRKLPPTEDDVRVYFHAELPVVYTDGTEFSYSIVVVCLPGMGRVEAVNTTKDAITRWKPRYVLLVGIAAGFEENAANLGDVLVSEQIVDYELQKIVDLSKWDALVGWVLGRPKPTEEYRFSVHRSDVRLMNAALNFLGDGWNDLIAIARPTNGKPKRLPGAMATGDKVVQRRTLVKALLDRWPKLIGLEMEAGGVASACFQAASRPGFFMIRGVSDLADEKKGTAGVKKWRKYASDVAASYAIALLSSGPIPIDGVTSEFRIQTDRSLSGAKIAIPGLPGSIPRAEVKDVEDQLQLGRAVALTGEPGSGKSGIGYMLAVAARSEGKEVLLLDARRVEHLRDEVDLRRFLSAEGPVSSEIRRIGRMGGCRLIIDQLDSAITLPSASVLIELALDCRDLEGVEVVVISRKREGREAKLISPLTAKGFVELESRELSEAESSRLLTELKIRSPTDRLIKLGQNLLNLELIAKIKLENDAFDFSAVEEEVDLWEKYIDVLRESDSDGEDLIGLVVDLAGQALRSDDGRFKLSVPLNRPLIRLQSWGIIACEYGLIYAFSHEKLQDYFYAWEATERMAMPAEILHELNQHRSTSVLAWMKRIYSRHSPELLQRFLKEAWDV
jgi:nucleoside phosphorylase/energy-coupling factor transporter ATP-binding protein EcfA2